MMMTVFLVLVSLVVVAVIALGLVGLVIWLLKLKGRPSRPAAEATALVTSRLASLKAFLPENFQPFKLGVGVVFLGVVLLFFSKVFPNLASNINWTGLVLSLLGISAVTFMDGLPAKKMIAWVSGLVLACIVLFAAPGAIRDWRKSEQAKLNPAESFTIGVDKRYSDLHYDERDKLEVELPRDFEAKLWYRFGDSDFQALETSFIGQRRVGQIVVPKDSGPLAFSTNRAKGGQVKVSRQRPDVVDISEQFPVSNHWAPYPERFNKEDSVTLELDSGFSGNVRYQLLDKTGSEILDKVIKSSEGKVEFEVEQDNVQLVLAAWDLEEETRVHVRKVGSKKSPPERSRVAAVSLPRWEVATNGTLTPRLQPGQMIEKTFVLPVGIATPWINVLDGGRYNLIGDYEENEAYYQIEGKEPILVKWDEPIRFPIITGSYRARFIGPNNGVCTVKVIVIRP